jgi:hypothetical protein
MRHRLVRDERGLFVAIHADTGERLTIAGRPDAFYGIVEHLPWASQGRLLVVGYLFGDLTVAQLDMELDFYMRGFHD